MRRPVALEDFGPSLLPDQAGSGEPDLDAMVPDATAAPAATEPEFVPEPEPDPETQRTAGLLRIADSLETLAAEHAGLRSRCIGQATAALGTAAAALLPALAREGFPALVADTARTIAENAEWPQLRITLAPDEAELVQRFLGDSAAAPRIRVAARPDAVPGEARIDWDGGGAELDAQAMAAALLTEYRHRLDTLSQGGA